MIVLETKKLTKHYGKIQALNDLDLQINDGMVFGFLGPNGSGKTTTLALLLSVLQPTRGTYSWFGHPVTTNVRKQIGAILETPCFYPYLTGYQNLSIAAKIKECTMSAIDASLKIVDLFDRKDDLFKTYSLGMKQRLAIASALLSDPKVLILDEPTNGLDPMGIVEIRNLIRKIASSGKTIVLASHLLDEVEKVCTHFMVLKNGIKLFQGSVKEALSDRAVIDISSADLGHAFIVAQGIRGVKSIEQKEDRIIISAPGISPQEVNAYFISHNIVLSRLQEKSGNLEEQFLSILSEH
ncbi:MAG: ABC transporter ATP-binding protein [Saprospiraceae bacterium]|nr:ABC transporter ATP-binding protein [Saprospiraceae bacterium]